jgi:hypothetical protein
MKGVAHACKTIFIMVQDAVAEVVGHGGGVVTGDAKLRIRALRRAQTTPERRAALKVRRRPPCWPGHAWVEPIESGIRGWIRERIEELVEQELASALRRARDERGWHIGSPARLRVAADGLFRAGGEVGVAGAAARAERHGAEAAQRSPA